MRDMDKKGRCRATGAPKGEANHMAKIRARLAVAIRVLFKNGVLNRMQLAEFTGLSYIGIYQITTGINWGHLSDDLLLIP